MNTLFFSRQQYWLALIFGCLLVFLAASLGHGQWLDYAQRVATLDEPLSRLRWIVGDISEVAFYKHELPALGLLLGRAWRTGRSCEGTAGRALPSAMAADYGHGCLPARFWACCLAMCCGDGPWPVAPGNPPSLPSCHCRQPWSCFLVRAGG